MKNLGLIFITIFLSVSLVAQQKDFEGLIEYNVQVKSKVEGMSDKTMQLLLATTDRLTVFVKEGNYFRSSGFCDEYYIPKKERVYLKFKTIDTLYYLDYSYDTSSLLSVEKLNQMKTFAGQKCNSILIKTSGGTEKYFYAPALYINPEYDRNNKIGRYDIYTKETSSVWLASYKETEKYSLTYESSRVEAKKIDESVFTLPKLPEKKFSLESISKAPEFTGSGGWIKYISTSIDPTIGAKYVKVKKGEQVGTVTVIVKFLIDEFGIVSKVEVVNRKEVHPKLAEEAMRVISSSPIWTPATIYGQKTIHWFKQPIIFQTEK
jgi:Gram-negative bacterial TonB protein C-terminal